MIRLHYALTIDVQSDRDLPQEVVAEIMADAEPRDRDWTDKVRRYVGGALSDGADDIGAALPEGFSVRIDDVAQVDQVTL